MGTRTTVRSRLFHSVVMAVGKAVLELCRPEMLTTKQGDASRDGDLKPIRLRLSVGLGFSFGLRLSLGLRVRLRLGLRSLRLRLRLGFRSLRLSLGLRLTLGCLLKSIMRLKS